MTNLPNDNAFGAALTAAHEALTGFTSSKAAREQVRAAVSDEDLQHALVQIRAVVHQTALADDFLRLCLDDRGETDRATIERERINRLGEAAD